MSIAAYASFSARPPMLTIATAPSSDAAGRVSRKRGNPCAAISKYLTRRIARRIDGTCGAGVIVSAQCAFADGER